MIETEKAGAPAPMYWLALVLCLPVILISIVVPLWFGWHWAHRLTAATGIVALGMDQFGLYVLTVAVFAVGWKVGAPLAFSCTVGRHPVAAKILVLPWLAGLAGSCVIMIAGSLPMLPPQHDGELPRYILWDFWLVLDVCASLMPVALTRLPAWRRDGRLLETPATANVARPPAFAIALHPTTLLAFLERVQQATPQVVADARLVTVARTGEIITTQGALAKLLHTTKGTVHRRLHELAAQRRIILQTSARRTCIRVVAQQAAAQAERSGTFVKTD